MIGVSGTSICESVARATQRTDAARKVGANPTRMRTFDGMWLKTIVLTSPNSRASGAARISESPAARLLRKKTNPRKSTAGWNWVEK